MIEFTLLNLVKTIEQAGYRVVDSGPDDQPEIAELRALMPNFPGAGPRFFVRVELPFDPIQAFARVSEAVWSRFTRGQMEFHAQADGNWSTVTVTQMLAKAGRESIQAEQRRCSHRYQQARMGRAMSKTKPKAEQDAERVRVQLRRFGILDDEDETKIGVRRGEVYLASLPFGATVIDAPAMAAALETLPDDTPHGDGCDEETTVWNVIMDHAG